MLNRMKAIIRENDMCVLATTDGCKPHTSLMTYFPGEDGTSIYMMTGKLTRKYTNILSNKYVSLLIDTRLMHHDTPHLGTIALTAEGVASITGSETTPDIYKTITSKYRHLEGIAPQADTAIICVQLQTLQLLDGVADMYVIQI